MKQKSKRAHTARDGAAPYGVRAAETIDLPAELLEIGEKYMQDLKEKARLVSHALAEAGIPHAVIGGLAVAAHIVRVAPEAERNTKDMDILLDPRDIPQAGEALRKLGFKLRKVLGIWAFVLPGGKFQDAIHVVQAGKKVRTEYTHPAPAVPNESRALITENVRYLALADLLTMKLTSFRLKDQVHVQDLLGVGLITKKIEASLPPDLRARLSEVKEITKREQLG